MHSKDIDRMENILVTQPLPSFWGCAGRFVSYRVTNPEDRFSHDEARIIKGQFKDIYSNFSGIWSFRSFMVCTEFCLFDLWFYVPVNNYGHVEMVMLI